MGEARANNLFEELDGGLPQGWKFVRNAEASRSLCLFGFLECCRWWQIVDEQKKTTSISITTCALSIGFAIT